MKPVCFLFSLIVVLGLGACNKEAIKNSAPLTKKDTTQINTGVTNNTPVIKPDTVSNTALLGKWKIIGNMISAGGPMYFVPAENVDYVVFNSNGSVDGSAFPGLVFYTLKDNVTIHLTKTDKTTYVDYRSGIKNDTLTMSLAGPVYCIEGCAIKLIKE
jgi:hypothetical protein